MVLDKQIFNHIVLLHNKPHEPSLCQHFGMQIMNNLIFELLHKGVWDRFGPRRQRTHCQLLIDLVSENKGGQNRAVLPLGI